MLIGIFMAFDTERPPLDWKSAQWLPVYLIGMGIISWQGQFSGGAVKARAATPVTSRSGVDMLVVAVLQPGHLLLGQATKLPREEMQAAGGATRRTSRARRPSSPADAHSGAHPASD